MAPEHSLHDRLHGGRPCPEQQDPAGPCPVCERRIRDSEDDREFSEWVGRGWGA